MDYSKYKVEEFLLDDQFKKWILNPDKEDNIFWQNWLAKNPNKYSEIAEARDVLLNLAMNQHKLTVRESDELWNRIEAGSESDLLIPETRVIPINQYSVLKRSETKTEYKNYQWLSIAAILIIMAIFSGVLIKLNLSVDVGPAEAMVHKVTEWGMKSQFTLSDGTKVTLNSGSKLSYLPNFTGHSRNVYLEGEAYFEVAKDKKRPFNVYSGGMVTTAIGTAFNVNNYPESKNVYIALVEGKVLVSAKDTTVFNEKYILSPGDMAKYYPGSARIDILSFDEKKTISWKEGNLYFSHAEEAEIFSRLEKWYGVNIEVQNATRKKFDYSAEFKNQSLEQVLTSLSFTMSFDFKITNSTVYITYYNQ